MYQHTFLFVGLVALVATMTTLRSADEQLAIVSGLIGTISWGVWAYSALNVVVISNGTELAQQYPSLAAFGVMLTIPNLFVVLYGPLVIARDSRELTNELQ